MSWNEVDANHELELGHTYRITLWIRLPENMKGNVLNAVKAVDSFWDRVPATVRNILGSIDITKAEVGAANTNSMTGRIEPWPLRITFKKVHAGTPFHIIVGAIIALIIVAVGAFVIVGRTLEAYSEEFKETIFNPAYGVILLVLGGLYLTRRG